jgi:hypothetical protein
VLLVERLLELGQCRQVPVLLLQAGTEVGHAITTAAISTTTVAAATAAVASTTVAATTIAAAAAAGITVRSTVAR